MKPRYLKKQITELKEQGKTAPEIAKELNCSVNNIYYYYSDGYRDRVLAYQKEHRKRPVITVEKAKRQKYENVFQPSRNLKRTKIKKYDNGGFCTYEEFKQMLNDTICCYITGRPINIDEPSSYQIDHKIPVSRGGTNDITNLAVACRDGNMAKSSKTIEEFIELCKEVLIFHGYSIKK